MRGKHICSLMAICLILSFLAACGSGISEEQYNQVCAERDALQAELDLLKAEDGKDEILKARVSGTFTATVRHIIPGYVVDNTTPKVAVVTPFQDVPYALYVDDIAEQLEIGETYVFEVEPKEVEITLQEYERGIPFFEEAMARYWLAISDFSAAGEEDYGLEVTHLVYELL